MQQDSAAFSTSSAADVARLETSLGQRDKSKLDEYLEAIRDIERRIQKAEAAERVDEDAADGAAARDSGRVRRSRKLMTDLMVVAFQTDMTRVVTFMMAREGSNRQLSRRSRFRTGITR